MVERVPGAKQLGVHRASGEGLQCDRSDEFLRGAGHDDVDLSPRLHEQAGEPRGLVAGDSARDPEKDATAVEGAHGWGG